MAFADLGARGPIKGALDTTGRNPGNWTVTLDPTILNVTQPQFEVYKMVVTGASAVATFQIYRDLTPWDLAVYGTQNSWDGFNPLILKPGNTVYFFYSTPATDGFQPQVTVHMRYDPALRQIYGIG